MSGSLLVAREDERRPSATRPSSQSSRSSCDDRRHVLGRHRLRDSGGRRRRSSASQQPPRHSTARSVTSPSGVVSPGATPSSRSNASSTACALTSAAADVRADLDRVPADGLEVEHVVEARDGHAVRGRQVERVGDLLERLARQPAVALLGEPQRGQDRRASPPGSCARDLLHLVVERCSPVGVSHHGVERADDRDQVGDERVGARHVAVASSATNDGARKWTRHGFGPPSETR